MAFKHLLKVNIDKIIIYYKKQNSIFYLYGPPSKTYNYCFQTTPMQHWSRNMSIIAKTLKYSKFGQPAEVLQLVEEKLEKPQKNQVLVKILAAPVNPSDVLTIQGVYPSKSQFPAGCGKECVGEILEVGEGVTNLSKGQHVVPFATGNGTWATHALFSKDQLIPVSKKINLAAAATIIVNPCTAYRMLKDFVKLSPGDCIIQNGANSAAGQAVHQLCQAWGIKSVGIVRNRNDIDELKSYLKSLGATEILTEEELRSTTIFEEGKLPKPKLAFNCVGGKSATEVARQLADKGIMVTYGAMSPEPVEATAAALIFKDIAFRGFWMARWAKENTDASEFNKMFKELCDLMEQNKFVAPVHEMVPLHKFKDAVTNSSSFKGFAGKKFILDMQNNVSKI